MKHYIRGGIRYFLLGLITLLLIIGLRLPGQISAATDNQVAKNTISPQLQEVIQLWEQGIHQLEQQAQPNAALDRLFQALTLVQGLNEPLAIFGEAAIENQIGNTYVYLGQYQKALHFYQQALAIYQEQNDFTGQVSIYSNLGHLYRRIGQYSQALDYHQQALEIVKQHLSDQSQKQGEVLSNFGVTYDSLGQLDKALDHYQQALTLNSNSKWQANILNNIGNVYDRKNQYKKALDFYEQALVIAKAEEDQSLQGRILSQMGLVFNHLKEYRKALDTLYEAREIRHQANDLLGEGITLDNLGTVYRDWGDYETALENHRQALDIIRSYQLPERQEEGRILSHLGYTLMQMNQPNQAAQSLFEAVDILESLRPGLSDDHKVSLQELQTQTYEWLQEVLVQQNQVAAALEVSERGRARAFAELIASRLTLPDRVNQTPPAPTFVEIQQIARHQQATIVEYTYLQNQELLYIWVIQPDGQLDFRAVNLSEETPIQASQFLPTLNPEQNPAKVLLAHNSSDLQNIRQRRQRLNRRKIYSYEYLIQPIADLLPTDPNAHIIFIPHKNLFQVAFAALKDDRDQYLIENHTLSFSPSIQVLDLTQQKQQKLIQQSDYLIIGNPQMPILAGQTQPLPPLPGTEKEAQVIAQLLKTEAILGQQATEEIVLQKMPDARIIHFATHGLLGELKDLGLEIPGALALTPTAQFDPIQMPHNGLLTAEEILDLQLNAELVVLSACYTGLGDITADGVIGLSRAFMSAGVPSIIVSLAEIPDQPSAELMIEFYHQMQQTQDKAVALRQAMLKTMQDHPALENWAAFLLIGQPC